MGAYCPPSAKSGAINTNNPKRGSLLDLILTQKLKSSGVLPLISVITVQLPALGTLAYRNLKLE